ncbi:hypothetical protein Hamer_G027501 [Homarus americanus]|uniref:Ig-like domain-containing protein n=1 Tax=Homarus americanus TaxID=6706 RepID=A0A8J5JR68_HOMAM|nr:hypothetical protein Hamer_G027501 [Homarus americanus]
MSKWMTFSLPSGVKQLAKSITFLEMRQTFLTFPYPSPKPLRLHLLYAPLGLVYHHPHTTTTLHHSNPHTTISTTIPTPYHHYPHYHYQNHPTSPSPHHHTATTTTTDVPEEIEPNSMTEGENVTMICNLKANPVVKKVSWYHKKDPDSLSGLPGRSRQDLSYEDCLRTSQQGRKFFGEGQQTGNLVRQNATAGVSSSERQEVELRNIQRQQADVPVCSDTDRVSGSVGDDEAAELSCQRSHPARSPSAGNQTLLTPYTHHQTTDTLFVSLSCLASLVVWRQFVAEVSNLMELPATCYSISPRRCTYDREALHPGTYLLGIYARTSKGRASSEFLHGFTLPPKPGNWPPVVPTPTRLQDLMKVYKSYPGNHYMSSQTSCKLYSVSTQQQNRDRENRGKKEKKKMMKKKQDKCLQKRRWNENNT